MKVSSSAAATRQVLADIDEAVRSVERARTAAAVERVLATVTPGCVMDRSCCVPNGCSPNDRRGFMPRDSLGFVLQAETSMSRPKLTRLRRQYAPEVVSPHLFEDGDQ